MKNVISKMTTIVHRLDNVKSQISALAREYETSTPELLTVSKTKPIEMIKQVYDAGQRHFGENYVQEIEEKFSKLPLDIRWHMIGHLQTNKVKSLLAVKNLHAIESIDSEKLANKVNSTLESFDRSLDVMVEINTSGEDTKSGVTEEDAEKLVQYLISNCRQLNFTGFMTVGSPDPHQIDGCFTKMSSLKSMIESKYKIKVKLSMGMTNDLREAIKNGSDQVRVGSAIFGPRQ
eukprot:GHVL01034014.1.p1 GENE.GHVL01034014.1~~GHVL01034014.1.p1  ORF type:complete len:242 (-),score=50.16 GHVL01034014.1:181-879(-)